MATGNFSLSISEESVASFENRLNTDRRFGADVKFLGVVRHLENGREIKGIDYSCYEPMASRELEKLCLQMEAENPEHRVLIHHQTGFVAAGEPSIVIHLQAPHSAEAFTLCQEYLRRIKTSVPIWKKPIFADE